MGIGYVPAGLTAEQVWDFLLSLAVDPMTIGDALRWAIGDYMYLADHFEATVIGDLVQPYTIAVVGGGAANLYVDNDPSVYQIDTGAVLNDGASISSDRTLSLLELGGTILVFEFRMRLNSETNIMFVAGIENATTNIDRVRFHLDTAAAAPRNAGALETRVDGVATYVALNLTGLYNLAEFHTYRLEIEPGVNVDAFVDDTLVGSQAIGGNVPVDQSFIVNLGCYTRAAAQKLACFDYFRVWSE